jgi:hypothetical protein
MTAANTSVTTKPHILPFTIAVVRDQDVRLTGDLTPAQTAEIAAAKQVILRRL